MKLFGKKEKTVRHVNEIKAEPEEEMVEQDEIKIIADPKCEYEVIERIIRPEMRRCMVCHELTPMGLDHCTRCGSTLEESKL